MTAEAPISYESLRRAWDAAARIVAHRPWLTISWIAHPEAQPHLVVHDGAVGASLHFDDEAGPTFAGEIGLRSLEWEDAAMGEADWMAEWGPMDAKPELTHKSATYLLLSALVAAGRAPDAVAALAAARDADPSNAQAWLLSATLARRLERLGEAQRHIEYAATLAPRDPAIGLEAGVIAAMAGREDQARASFASVIEVAPDSVEAGRARTYLTRLDGGAQQEGPSGR